VLAQAGFERIDVEVTRAYGAEQAGCGGECMPRPAAFSAFHATGGRFVSAFVRATKPERPSSFG
jgi:hypothetical protein